jgi:branched-chain amino acid transport system substrate-binding protein
VGLVFRYNYKFDSATVILTKGIEAAKDLYEKTHKGVKINLKSYPHDQSLESVVVAANKVIADGLPAIIGGNQSDESMVLSEQLEPKKIIFITPTSSNPKVTENKKFTFRTCFTDTQVADELAKFVVENLKPTALGVIHNTSEPYSDYLTSTFLNALKGSTNKIPIFEQKTVRKQFSFKEAIDTFIKNKVSHVAMLTYDTDLFRFYAEAAKENFFPVYVGSDGWGSDKYVYRSLIEGQPAGDRFIAYRNTYWNADAKRKLTDQFRNTFETLHNEEPNEWSAIAFDTAWVLFNAMDRAKDPKNTDQIRAELLKLKNISLVTSPSFSFGKNNSPDKELYIFPSAIWLTRTWHRI